MSDLAIIIPAYKIDFFKDTLDSLVRQTCKDFTVYIGDDCSPGDFKSLIAEYEDKIHIVYCRFDENLGGKDLVGHWKRCIDLTQDESWLWLFSDDDVIGERCVELFYKEIEDGAGYDIYHFDVNIINSGGIVVSIPKAYPALFNALDFYKQKATGKIESYVVENIFSRDIYNRIGGFVKFDMAWGSDTATWVLMSLEKGMKCIEGDFVLWRKSDLNITPKNTRKMCIRKLKSNIEFSAWINKTFGSKNIHRFQIGYMLRRFHLYQNFIQNSDIEEILSEAKEKKVMTSFEKHICSIIIKTLKRVRV